MKKTLLIIISGPPCTGKTTLGKELSKEFCIPHFSKDDIKESLFDSLGIRDRKWSKKLGIASYSILYNLVKSLLATGQSLIVESNFKPEYDTKYFLDFQKNYDFLPIQIQCKCDGEILYERFKQRSESGERHPGHVDHLNYKEFEATLLKGEHEPIDINGKVFDLDTTDFDSIDYQALFNAIRSAANGTQRIYGFVPDGHFAQKTQCS